MTVWVSSNFFFCIVRCIRAFFEYIYLISLLWLEYKFLDFKWQFWKKLIKMWICKSYFCQLNTIFWKYSRNWRKKMILWGFELNLCNIFFLCSSEATREVMFMWKKWIDNIFLHDYKLMDQIYCKSIEMYWHTDSNDKKCVLYLLIKRIFDKNWKVEFVIGSSSIGLIDIGWTEANRLQHWIGYIRHDSLFRY